MLLSSLLLLVTLGAQEYGADPAVPQSRQLQELNAEFEAAMGAWSLEAEAMVAEFEGEEFDYGLLPKAPYAAFYSRYRGLADDGIVDARVWCLDYVSYSGLTDENQRAFLRGEAISLAMVLRADEERAIRLAILLSSLSTMGFAKECNDALAFQQSVAEADAIIRAAISCRRMALGILAHEGDPDAESQIAAITEELLSRWPDSRAAQQIQRQEFANKNLVVGKVAPKLVGLDVDGRSIDLEDYRGKVVVVDFWGFW